MRMMRQPHLEMPSQAPIAEVRGVGIVDHGVSAGADPLPDSVHIFLPVTLKHPVTPPTFSDRAITTASGLKIEDFVTGLGNRAVSGKWATVDFRVFLADGTFVDATLGRAPFQFVLGSGGVIDGFDEGVTGMHVGGRRGLMVPAALAYGREGFPPLIPPNATMIFEVWLLSVED